MAPFCVPAWSLLDFGHRNPAGVDWACMIGIHTGQAPVQPHMAGPLALIVIGKYGWIEVVQWGIFCPTRSKALGHQPSQWATHLLACSHTPGSRYHPLLAVSVANFKKSMRGGLCDMVARHCWEIREMHFQTVSEQQGPRTCLPQLLSPQSVFLNPVA